MAADAEWVLVAVAALGAGSHWLAWRLKLPAILPLLLVGLVLGPGTDWLDPDAVFGDLLFPFVSLGVAVILFEGALTLRLHEVREHGAVVRNLVTFGVLLNAGLVGLATAAIADLPLALGLLFGALVSVTGPTVIGPLPRVVRPTPAVAAVLRWEGVLIDPIGALLAVVVYTFIVSAQAGHTLAAFAGSIGVGCLTGLLAGLALAEVLRRHWVPEYLRGVTTLAWVLLLFVVANATAREGGLVAVTTMGILLANVKGLDLEDILSFKESLTVMLIGALFIVLAARVDLTPLLGAWRPAVAVLLVVLFVARPVAVLAATLGSKLAWRERALVAWIAPRGIVAAAVSALFSLRACEEFPGPRSTHCATG